VVQKQSFFGNCKTIYFKFNFEPQDELIRNYFKKSAPGDHSYRTRQVNLLFNIIAKEIETQKDFFILTHQP
jgi:hypothetical protein